MGLRVAGHYRQIFMINLGVIGVGPIWEGYRSVLPQLRKLPHIAAVYDPNLSRAHQVGKELDAVVLSGIQTMACSKDVSAILLADVGWLGSQPINLLSEWHKPVFIAPWLPATTSCYTRWYDANSKRGVTLMPALWRRFMPVAVRLKELFATELGLPCRVNFSVDLSGTACLVEASEALLGWIDFVWFLIPREPTKVWLECCKSESTPTTTIHIEFPPTKPHPIEGAQHQAGGTCHVSITVQGCPGAETVADLVRRATNAPPPTGDWSHPNLMPVPRVTLECLRGEAVIENRALLHWESHGQARKTESLESERSERVVMLDHFFRRAVGGLIPVADFYDLHRAIRIATSEVGSSSG